MRQLTQEERAAWDEYDEAWERAKNHVKLALRAIRNAHKEVPRPVNEYCASAAPFITGLNKAENELVRILEEYS